MSVNPIQQDGPIQQGGNAVDRLRSRIEAITETTVDPRALVEQLETVLEILDQPASGSVSQRAHHPSARGRNRKSAKSKQDKLQAALSQLLVEQQQQQQIEREFAAAQETVKQLVDLVSRRDKQLVSARHAWDLLKSRTRHAAEESSNRISELEAKIEILGVAHRDLEAHRAQSRHDAASSHDEQASTEQASTAETITQTAELATSLAQQLARSQEEISLMTVRRDELLSALDRSERQYRSTSDAAREREAILVQQLEEVQLLLKREQQCRRHWEHDFRVAVQQLDEARQQAEAIRRESVGHECQHRLDKAQLTDGVQALKAELHQLHVERLVTNGFIERMFEEQKIDREAANQRERNLNQSCAQANSLSESRAEQIAGLESELQNLRKVFNLAVANHAATVAEHQRTTSELHADYKRFRETQSTNDAAKDTEMAKLRSGMQRAAIMLESQRRQLAEAEQCLAEEQAGATKNAALQAEQDALISKLQAKIDSLQTILQREAAGRRKAESRVKAGGEEAAAGQLTIEDAEQKIDQLSDELAAFKKLAKTLKHKGSQKMRQARAEIARLRAQIESLSPRQV